jgi:ribokinase
MPLAAGGAGRIDTSAVVRRGRSALLVDVVDQPGSRRLLEDIPEESLITVQDLHRAHAVLEQPDTVSIQRQQPARTILATARAARARRIRVVADGAPDAGVRDELLTLVDVLRADDKEAELIAGEPGHPVDAALALGRCRSPQAPR